MYNQMSFIMPVVMAGARDLMGFMEAPDMGPKNQTSKATTLPTTSPATTPCTLVLTIHSMPPIKSMVASTSMLKKVTKSKE